MCRLRDPSCVVGVAVTLLFCFVGVVSSEEVSCPNYACPKVLCELKGNEAQGFCEGVSCVGIEVNDCRSSEGTGHTIYQEHLTMCGCCPGCARYLGKGDECQYTPPDPEADGDCTGQFCAIQMHRCAPGLSCQLVGPSELRCNFDSDGDLGSTLTSCSDKRALSMTGDLKHWTPSCELDGSYSPKQCKGSYSSGICFCVDKEGNRIFGSEVQNKAKNQTCACSRQAHELRESGHIASLHCSADGNYEPLQCDTETGLCYCVNPETGLTTGAVLPESQWKSLPCYSLNYTNFDPEGGYYRRCESEWAIARKLAIEASLHGLTVLSGRRLTCDPDGSYAPVQNMDGRTKCVTVDGSLIGNNQDTEDKYDSNCQCVRDEIRATENSLPFLKWCEVITGNYDVISPTVQTPPFRYSCVDRDGIFYGDEAEEEFRCCLFGTLNDPRNCTQEPDEVTRMCWDPNASDEDNQGKIHPCYYWPT